MQRETRYQTLVIDTPINSNGNVVSYNLRIIQEYFQPKIGKKIRIFSLGWKNNFLIKKAHIALMCLHSVLRARAPMMRALVMCAR